MSDHSHERWQKRHREDGYHEIHVRCSGQIHVVQWRPRGAIRLVNHPRSDMKALLTLRALGDNTCGCLNAIELVREKMKQSMPTTRGVRKGWLVPLKAATVAHEQRNNNPALRPSDQRFLPPGKRVVPWGTDASERTTFWRVARDEYFDDLRDNVLGALHRLRPFGVEIRNLAVVRIGPSVEPIAYFSVTLGTDYNKTHFVARSVEAAVGVPLIWLRLVGLHLSYLPGHGLVLALEHVAPNGKEAVVVVARLERLVAKTVMESVPESVRDIVGYAVVARRARVRRMSPTEWSLTAWLE